MSDPLIGPLIAVSLHEAIGELAPTRLDFYEHWLRPDRLQSPMGAAPFLAVLSFLRREGGRGDQYDSIVERAGWHTANWYFEEFSAPVRGAVLRLPQALRVRAAVSMARRLVRRTASNTRAVARVRKGAGQIAIRASVFCDTRVTGAAPLCGYYVALLARLFERVGVDASVNPERCRANGHEECVITFQAPSRESA